MLCELNFLFVAIGSMWIDANWGRRRLKIAGAMRQVWGASELWDAMIDLNISDLLCSASCSCFVVQTEYVGNRGKKKNKGQQWRLFSVDDTFSLPCRLLWQELSKKNIAASGVTVRFNRCGSSQQQEASRFSDLPEKSRNKYYISADLGSVPSGVPGCWFFFRSAIVVTDCILA